MSRLRMAFGLFISIAVIVPLASFSQELISPDDYLGFQIGADKKLADYEEVKGYLEKLAEASPWVDLWDIGKTTLGKPFIMTVISTPENLKNLERSIDISRRLADPRKLSPEEADKLTDEGKILVMITCNLHSTEIGSSQMALELAYDIAAGRNETIVDALDEAIFFLIPSLNPDGLQMVVDWYEEWVGTEYEGGRMPWLYHHYAGHDNNRDWFMLNLAETRAVFDLYFRTVVPHVILDMHQMWSSGARLFLPQFYAPANVNVDPIVYREVGLLGYFMQLECEERGYRGVISDAYFTAWWEGTSMMTPWWHNQVGLLSEMASVHIASPIYIEEGELRGGSKGFPRYEHRINFPNPWPGGWWRLRDIVDYELAISEALLDCCARHRKRFLDNFYLMGAKAIETGRTESPYGFILPAPQRDPVTTARFIEALMLGGIEVHRAVEDFSACNRLYRSGSYVIRLDQPYRAYAKDLLEVQDYPDIRATKKEPFVRPYDVTGWTVPMQMGLACEEIEEPFEANLELLTSFPYPKGHFPAESGWGYALRSEVNACYRAVNTLLENGFTVYRADTEIQLDTQPEKGVKKVTTISAGAFLIPVQKDLAKLCGPLSTQLHIEFLPLEDEPDIARHRLMPAKTALFKPWRASMDEGWTRCLFDTNDIPYTNVFNEDIKEGRIKKYHALVLPDVSPHVIKKGKPPERRGRVFRSLPPEYAGGIEKEGVDNIKKFVEEGGALICFDSSCDFAIEAFELPVRNVLKDVSNEEFYCPGTILKVTFKNGHPITYGMPREGYILFANSPAFSTSVPFGKIDRAVLASYREKDPKASGLLIGGERLYRRAALVEVAYGKGIILLFGFRPQNRCQTAGTYKLIFNALLEARSPRPKDQKM